MNTPDYLRIDLPDVEYMRIVPIVPLSYFCRFWDRLGCVPASYLTSALKFERVKQNIYNCATCVIIDTFDFDASVLPKLKKLRHVQITDSTKKWTGHADLGLILSKLHNNGVDIQFKDKVTPKMLVNCELFSLIPIIIPTYTYKEIKELVYMLLNSPRPGLHKCIACIIAYKPRLKSLIRQYVEHMITLEHLESKPDRNKIKLLTHTDKCVFAR